MKTYLNSRFFFQFSKLFSLVPLRYADRLFLRKLPIFSWLDHSTGKQLDLPETFCYRQYGQELKRNDSLFGSCNKLVS